MKEKTLAMYFNIDKLVFSTNRGFRVILAALYSSIKLSNKLESSVGAWNALEIFLVSMRQSPS